MAQPTVKELIDAGRRAEAAGDLEAANRFRTAAQTAIQSDTTRFTADPIESQAPPAGRGTISERLFGAGEVATTFMTGALTQALAAGPAGIFNTVRGLVNGVDDPLRLGAETVEDVSERFTFQPRTEAGQQGLENLMPVFEAIDRFTTGAGNQVVDPSETLGKGSGSPAAATGIKTLLDTFPLALTGRRPSVDNTRISLGQRSRDIRELNEVAERQGVDLTAPQAEQRSQIIGTAEERVSNQEFAAENFELIQQSVIRAREEAKNIVDTMFDNARESGNNASVRAPEVNSLVNSINRSLDDFDLEVPEMARVNNVVSALNDLSKNENTFVILNEFAKLRKRTNARINDPSANAAMGVVRGQIDNWLQGMFDRDMIFGDEAAVLDWRRANRAYTAFKETFDEDATIRRLHEVEATPEQVKQWIFGANAAGARAQSGMVVNRLKDILGEDSPQFAALRQEVLFDVLEPLLRDEPNFRVFTNRYDRFRRNSPTLERELIPDSAQALGELRQLAAVVDRTEGNQITIDLSRGVAVAMFGHGIAQQAFKVSLARRVIDRMTGQSSTSRQRQIMADMLGYDPNMTLIPFGPTAAAGAIQTGLENDVETNQ